MSTTPQERAMPTNLMEGVMAELRRCRDLLRAYEAIPTGAFGAHLIRQAIREAEDAIASDDIIRLIQAYENLKGFQG